MSVEPKTEAERAVYNSLVVMLKDREKTPFTTEQFLAICRAAPDYALHLFTAHHTDLKYANGSARQQLARLVMTAEWELGGASAFIENYRIGHETEVMQFIADRLETHPQDFSTDDVKALLRHYSRIPSVYNAALTALSDHVRAFADRLLTEPPELSEDVQSLNRSISRYGFSDDLNTVLEKIDGELQQSRDGFDQLATMRNIRGFLESLQEHISLELQIRDPTAGNSTGLDRFSNSLHFLTEEQVITPKFKALGRALFDILSDGNFGVHALTATHDYTRLCRNMVVEYAVTLFLELERRLVQSGDN